MTKNLFGNEDNPPAMVKYPDGFVRFWAAWPKHFRKVAKSYCYTIWRRDKLEKLADTILLAVMAYRCGQVGNWAQQGGQFIPMPQTWLKGKRWDCEITIEVNSRQRQAAPQPDRVKEQIAVESRAMQAGWGKLSKPDRLPWMETAAAKHTGATVEAALWITAMVEWWAASGRAAWKAQQSPEQAQIPPAPPTAADPTAAT